jgi:hypothetical protein
MLKTRFSRRCKKSSSKLENYFFSAEKCVMSTQELGRCVSYLLECSKRVHVDVEKSNFHFPKMTFFSGEKTAFVHARRLKTR